MGTTMGGICNTKYVSIRQGFEKFNYQKLEKYHIDTKLPGISAAGNTIHILCSMYAELSPTSFFVSFHVCAWSTVNWKSYQ